MVNLKNIFSHFNTSGDFRDGYPYGSGHIHDTYKIETTGDNSFDYILQKINTSIFSDVDKLQENILLVTNHIRKKISSPGKNDINRKVLTIIPTIDDNLYFKDGKGDCWRMYIFISDHTSYDIVENTRQAFEGGKAIGRFQAQIADLDSSSVYETIPFFHDIEKRLDTFYNVIDADPCGRAAGIKDMIEFVDRRRNSMGTILRLGREGKIPLRITHNDTKFNNVLLDKNDNALCVIDLDTVMPGYVHYDFGDAIRTVANSSSEDEKDLSKVYLDIDLFRAYTEGYLSEIADVLTPAEIDLLYFAPSLITFTVGLRFLTDYVDGDKYFKIHHPDHNLQRARTQFKLVESNEEQYEKMKEIIRELVN